MSLRVDIDIKDNFVSEKAFAISDSLLRQRDPGDFTAQGLWLLPGGKAVTLLPDQVRSDWGTTRAVPKWGLSAWGAAPARWEQIARRGPGDWFLASKGLATSDGTAAGGPLPVTSAASLAENAGLYVELYGYGVPGARVPDLLQIAFAGGLVLHVHSDGHADLEDRRHGAPAGTYLTRGQSLTAGGAGGAGGPSLSGKGGAPAADLGGKLLGIVLLPYRRGRLLVVTSQGGSFEVLVGGRADASDAYKDRRTPGQDVYYVTTDPGPVTLTPSPAARALIAANPLTGIQSQTATPNGLLTSPLVSLPYDVAAGPSDIEGEADAQDGTALVLSVLNPDGSAFAPSDAARADALVYQVAFTGNPASPSALPFLYSLELRWERVLGAKTFGTTTVPTVHSVTGNVVSGKVSFSRDRGQKSAEVVIDNPGEHYTSLKDLYNRPFLISFTPDGVDVPFGIPAGEVLPVFLGLTDAVEFVVGAGSRLTVRASGLRKRLRAALLNDGQKFDGMVDTDVVRKLLTDQGVPPAQMVIYDAGGTALDAAGPGEDPLWQPANGTSADEFIAHLADTWSGWVWDDIGGVYYYVPRDYFTGAALAQNGGTIPRVFQSTPAGVSAGATRRPNGGLLVALDGSVKQAPEEPRANDFWVLGQDDDGNLLAAHFEDYGSIHTPTAPNYVGERRTLIYASGSLTTVGACQATLGALVPVLGQPVVPVSFALPDYPLTQIPLDGPVQLDGFGVGLITAAEADLANDRYRRTEYTYEVLQ